MRVAVGARAGAVLLAVSAATISGCVNPVLDRAMGRDAPAAVLPGNAVIPLSAARGISETLRIASQWS